MVFKLPQLFETLCLLLLAYVYAGISVIDQDSGDIDDELEAAKLAGKKKKSKKNKKKKMGDEDILMETPTADGLYILCVECTLMLTGPPLSGRYY